MNKKLSKALLTSASTLALLAAYPQVADQVENVGFDFSVATVHAADATVAGFVNESIAIPNVSAIEDMGAEELTDTVRQIKSARATYKSLSSSDKNHPSAIKWVGFLETKENSLVKEAILLAIDLPMVDQVRDATGTVLEGAKKDIDAVRELFDVLPEEAQAHPSVIKWAGFLTQKEDAVQVRKFAEFSIKLPSLAEISEMDAEELAKAETDIATAKEMFEALRPSAKQHPSAIKWAGFVDEKADAVKEAKEDVEDVELVVESVSAINGNQVTVEIKGAEGELSAADFKVTDDQGNTYAVVSVAPATPAGSYLLNLGTAVSGKGNLTVTFGGTSASKAYDTTIAGFSLGIEVADEDHTLTADGADNTVITVKALKEGELDEDFRGTVKFQSLKGAKFAKEEVAFDKGIAQVQVNSISSATEILDTIIATISNADDNALVGEQVRTNLNFVPATAVEDVERQVFATYAESASASEVYVKFNDKVNFEQLRKDIFNVVNPKTRVSVSPGANGNLARPTDIVKIDDTTIKLVFVADDAVTDNARITVQFTALDTKASTVQTSDVAFNLVDSKAPSAVGVKAFDYNTIVVEFNEPVNNVTEVTPLISNWVFNGRQLTESDLVDVKIGQPVNEDGDVRAYVYGTATDNRNFVTLKLKGANAEDDDIAGVELYKAEGKDNLLQAYSVEDYAAITDRSGQNVATTQEFVFQTPAKPVAPTLTVEQQSPEQFKLVFSSKVNVDEVLLDDEALSVTRLDGYKADKKTLNPAVKLEDYIITGGADGKTFYIELTKDWTDILQTHDSNVSYYTPGYNEVQITLNANKVRSSITGATVAKLTSKQTLALDATSPTFTAAQAIDNNGKLLPAVSVTMSEPVKIPAVNDTEGLTPALDQLGDEISVPVPTYEFISEDKKTTIKGKVDSISEDDKTFTIVPEEPGKLTAGKWTVVIRSISDDIGNTSATLTEDVVIEQAEATIGEPIVKFAAAFNNADIDDDGILNDYVVIQYGTEMSLDAIRSNIYQINDKVLPEGVRITSTTYEYDAVNKIEGTFVTIKLPENFLASNVTGEADFAGPHILNINKALTSEASVAIKGLTELELTFDRADSNTAITLTPAQVVDLIKQ